MDGFESQLQIAHSSIDFLKLVFFLLTLVSGFLLNFDFLLLTLVIGIGVAPLHYFHFV